MVETQQKLTVQKILLSHVEEIEMYSVFDLLETLDVYYSYFQVNSDFYIFMYTNSFVNLKEISDNFHVINEIKKTRKFSFRARESYLETIKCANNNFTKCFSILFPLINFVFQ